VLPDFDPTYAPTSIMETKIMEKKIQTHILFPDMVKNEIEGVFGNSYLRINLREPIIQFVPRELQHFRHYFESRIINDTDKQYTYAFIPSYIPNLNHLTLYISYSSLIEDEMNVDKDHDNFNSFQMESPKILHKLCPNVDSLNRFLKQHSETYPGISNENIKEKIRMCFEFCYWNLPDLTMDGKIMSIFPEKGFGFIDPGQKGMENIYFKTSSDTNVLSIGDYVSYDLKSSANGKFRASNLKKVEKTETRNKFSVIQNFIYDRPSSIVDIVVPRKTIAKIEEIDKNEEKINLISETPPVIARRAKVTFLINTGNEIKTKTQIMFVTKNVLDGLENGDLINCILAKSISPKRIGLHFSNFVVVGRVGPKIVFDIKHFVALAAWKKLQNIDDEKFLCNIGKLDDFKKIVYQLISQIDFDMLKFIDSDKVLNENIHLAIESLFPLFTLKDDIVYHNPPALISHIAHFYPNALADEELMNDISILFDTFLKEQKDWGASAKIKLRTHEYYEKLQLDEKMNIELNHFIKCIPSIANRVVYSRLFSQHWKQWLQ
jgi:cold shock CspA family protein